MTAARLRALTVLVAVCITVALAFASKPTRHVTDKLGMPDLQTLFPEKFGSWRIDVNAYVVLPDPQTQALLNKLYNQTLTRTYVDGTGNRIMLSVAYGGDQSDATRAHSPEVCYPAQGFQITQSFSEQIPLGDRQVKAKRLMSHQGLRNEPVTYWLVVGDQVTLSKTDQKLVELRWGLQGYIPDGMLVRVSSIDRDMTHGHQLQTQFLAELAEAIPPQGRDRVFGKKFI